MVTISWWRGSFVMFFSLQRKVLGLVFVALVVGLGIHSQDFSTFGREGSGFGRTGCTVH